MGRLIPLQSFYSPVSDGNGIIRLWGSPVITETGWYTEKRGENDIYCEFHIPAGFIHDSGNSFLFLFPFEYEKTSVKVYSYHGEIWSEPFWRLKEAGNKSVELQVDDRNNLPYLIVPDLGQPDYKEEKRYFARVSGDY